jgi:hypothetical protein
MKVGSLLLLSTQVVDTPLGCSLRPRMEANEPLPKGRAGRGTLPLNLALGRVSLLRNNTLHFTRRGTHIVLHHVYHHVFKDASQNACPNF